MSRLHVPAVLRGKRNRRLGDDDFDAIELALDTLTLRAPALAPPPGSISYLPPAYARPVVPVAATSYYLDAAAAPGGDGTSWAQAWNSPAALIANAAQIAGKTVALRGDFGPGVTLDLTTAMSGSAGAYTRFLVPPGESATFYGELALNARSAVRAYDMHHFVVEGDLRIRGDASVNGNNRRFIVVRCTDFQLVGLSVVGSYVAGDVGASVTMADNRIETCHRWWIDGCTFDVNGSLPEDAGNAGDCLFVCRGSTTGTIVRCNIGRAGHTGITLIGGEVVDGVTLPATTGITVALCEVTNNWTEFLNFNLTTADCLVEWNRCTNLGALKTNALSRGGILITGTGHIIRRNRFYGVYGTLFQFQAYLYLGGIMSSIGNTVVHNTAVGVGGPAALFRVKGNNNYPTEAEPDFWCQCRDNLLANNIVVDACRNGAPGGAQDHGIFFGNAYPLFVDHTNSNDDEYALWRAGGDWSANGNVVTNNMITAETAVGLGFPVRPMYAIGRNIPPYGMSEAYATEAAMLADFPAWTGNTFDVDPLLVSTAPGAEDVHLQVGSPARSRVAAVLADYDYAGVAPDLGVYEEA